MKKTIKMTLINIILAFGLAVFILYIGALKSSPSSLQMASLIITYAVIWIVQPVFVYHWAKEHNKKLEKEATLHT